MTAAKKVLIIRQLSGRTVTELAGYCHDAFGELGITAGIFDFHDRRLSARLPLLKAPERKYAESSLLRTVDAFKPDLVVVIKGTLIPIETVGKIRRRGIPVVNYWIDDPRHVDTAVALAAHYDHFFTNAPVCLETYRTHGIRRPHFLSFGCHPALHRRVAVSAQDRERYGSDICFAGTIDDKRLKVLEALSGFDLRIWARPLLHHFRDGCSITTAPVPAGSPARGKFTGTPLWGEDLVKAYNASRIVLNIHSPQNAPIMRDFEATGCGAFLLSDPAEGLEGFFRYGSELAVWTSVDELKEKVRYYLRHETERDAVASQGYERAHRDHTYAARMKELLAAAEAD